MQSFRSLALTLSAIRMPPGGWCSRPQRKERDRSRHRFNVRAELISDPLSSLRNYATAKSLSDELIDWQIKRRLVLEDLRNVAARLHSYHDRRRQGRSTNDYFPARRIPINGNSVVAAIVLIIFDDSYAALGQFDDAWRSVDEAKKVIGRTKETWFEANVHRIAGEIALKSPQPDVAKAEAHFERALAVARQQQAKSWELRAAMSMARLWRDQGKPQQARELLAPVYGWFTEGFDTLDLKEAKALLGELQA